MTSQSHALLRRWLKVADATAITTQKSLQRDLSYSKQISAVHRSEVLSLEWEASALNAPQAIQDLAMHTNLMLNPNKHHQELVFGNQPLKVRGNVWVLVSEPEDGHDLLETVNSRNLLPFSLTQAHWGTLWEIEITGPNPGSLVQEMAVAESRHQGLLGNPHFQSIHVLEDIPQGRHLVQLMHQQGAIL